ncbi:MAG: hypothetical protein J1E62_04390 [Lachnospiraceae bacterium]|nr:hypothetical protein [Lachnospiraceae bacterium]
MKNLYKFAVLLFVFTVALFIFGREIPSISVATTTATSLQDSTFPLVYLQIGNYTVNTLHGFSSELSSSNVRESITPLDTKKTFSIKIAENESNIKKLSYNLRDIANNKSIESGDVTAFDKKDNLKTVDIRLKEAMETSTEYGMQITLITNYSKKIHFYTRIKYYENDFYLKEKLNFISTFHDATFDKGKSLDISQYLETNSTDVDDKNQSFADVDIHSSQDLITWGKLKPQIISEIVPTIKELNIETGAIQQTYFINANTGDGTETFQIKEFYRVRYTSNRIYLLYFRRTMEAMFDPSLISVEKSELKVGISSKTDLEVATGDSNNKMAFVRNGSLWYYDMKKNDLYNVFTFQANTKDYERDYFDQHDIRILKVDNNGNISFVVYGYMNCGDYEGRVGILLYDYSASDNQITERVYVPLTTTYEQLKHDFGDFCYINNKNIFYFSLNDTVYAYNIASKRYDILTENASRNQFLMLEEAHCFVWSNASISGNATVLTILDLNSSKELTVQAPKGQSLMALGTIDSNIVYGFIRDKDIHESDMGETVRPAYKLIISDCDGNILREYRNKNIYVTNAVVEDNIIRLKRLKRSSGSWKKASDDSIMNQKDTSVESINLTAHDSKTALSEKFISLPAGFIMQSLPKISETKSVMITEDTTVHLKQEDTGSTTRYYVYAYGGITSSLTDSAKAIQLADEQMGVVMDSNSHIVWERGGKFISKELSNISYPSGSVSSTKACTQMLLQAAQVTTSVSDLKGNTIMKMLRSYLDTPVNLTGCTVDEILYFVSNEKPVIGMLSGDHAVLIIGYTSSSVTWMDPITHSKRTTSIVAAEKIFKESGYVFVSYI